jgi:hypothetical protein
MSKRVLLPGLVAAALAGCVSGDGDSELVIANRSDFVLVEVHIAEVNDPSWGPNLLPDVLFPGEDLVIVDIDCGTYDVLVVDELGTSCELASNRLCFDSDVWVIDNTTLAICAFAPRSQQDASPQASEPATTAI